MTDKNIFTAPPAVFSVSLNWSRLLILHVLMGLVLAYAFPQPWNFAIGAAMVALYWVRRRFFGKPVITIEGETVTFRQMGNRYHGPLHSMTIKGAGENFITGGWMLFELKGFGRRRLLLLPIDNVLEATQVIKAASDHYKALEKSDAR